jgi:hypothetical protein
MYPVQSVSDLTGSNTLTPAPLPSGEGFGHEAIENSQWPENDSSLNGDVSMGDNFGSLILMKPKPVAS